MTTESLMASLRKLRLSGLAGALDVRLQEAAGITRDSHRFLLAARAGGGWSRAMPRIGRIVIPGCPSRRAGMTQRGNNRQDVFFVDDDRRAYLSILAEAGGRVGRRCLTEG